MADNESKDFDSPSAVAGQKRGNTDNGGPASKKANVTDQEGLVFCVLNNSNPFFVVQIKVLIPAGAVGALVSKIFA